MIPSSFVVALFRQPLSGALSVVATEARTLNNINKARTLNNINKARVLNNINKARILNNINKATILLKIVTHYYEMLFRLAYALKRNNPKKGSTMFYHS